MRGFLLDGDRKSAGAPRQEWRIEQDDQQLTDELGLDPFEGRTWFGWHRHVTLMMLAYAFLLWSGSRGKKGAQIDGATGAGDIRDTSDSSNGNSLKKNISGPRIGMRAARQSAPSNRRGSLMYFLHTGTAPNRQHMRLTAHP